MAKVPQPAMLNELQMATYREMQKLSEHDRLDGAFVLTEYKSNVVGALVRRGLLQEHKTKRQHYFRLTNVPALLRSPPTKRRRRDAEDSAPA